MSDGFDERADRAFGEVASALGVDPEALDPLRGLFNELLASKRKLEAENERVNRDLADERARTTELEETVEQQAERIDELEDGNDQSDENNEPDDRRSSLAQLIDLPAEKAKEVLPENGQRARIVAMRLPEFGRKAMEGRWILDSAGVKELLRDLGVNPHDETASRVMNFIADLGQDDVEDKIHKGNRILVFDPDRVAEYGTGDEPAEIRSHRDVIFSREGRPGKATA